MTYDGQGAIASSTPFYLHSDHLNTPRLATDQSQQTIWQWQSDAFGVGQASGSLSMNLRFPGQYFDQESGLHYNYFRDYDPETGRYVESDPIGLKGGLNTYGYVLGNPLKYSDPKGLNPLALCFVPGIGWAACGTAAEAAISACAAVGTAVVGALLGGLLAEEAASDAGNDASKGREKDVPNRGEPNEVREGKRRTREYDSEGKPKRDYDQPHQGHETPHVHEWENGVREHPGRDYSPLP